MPNGVMLTYDRIGPNNRGIDSPDYNSPASVERQYFNFDGVQGIDLRTYRMLDSIWVVGSVTDMNQPITIAWGATDYSGTPIEYGPDLPWDGGRDTDQLDYEAYGRWLGIKVTYTGTASFTLSGWDMSVKPTGNR